MKKVIEGKTYNTETADFVCGVSNDHGYAYFKGVDESLYRTSKGALFLHIEFGVEASWSNCSLSKWYPRDAFGPHQGKEIIALLTDDQAQWFVENFGDHDDYVTCFGEAEEA